MIQPGDKIGKFVVSRHLGAGGMGTVYEARDPELSRAVAIKFVLDAAADPIRLLREAQALARISHPNVVAVYELGSHGDVVFVAMELIDGVTIDRYIAANKCDWRAILGLYMQAGRGLAAVHQEGLVHRDIKPSNILVETDGRVCVGDFGLARRDDPTTDPAEAITRDGKAPSKSSVTVDGPTTTSIDSRPGPAPDGAALDAQITEHGAVVGTPRYMAPEQNAGKRATRSSDQYAFAVALWEAVYGELPGKDTREAPDGAAAPAWLERTLARALEADPDKRWPSMNALLAELERAPKRRTRLAIVAGSTVLVAGTVAALVGFGSFGGKKVDCERSGDPIAAAWTADARDRTTTGLGAIDPAWKQSVVATLDRWVERSRTVRIDACRATHDRGDQTAALLDKRVACLDAQQAVFAALLGALARADRQVAEHALAAAERLPAPETCTRARLVDTATPANASIDVALAEATVAVDLERADARVLTERVLAQSQTLEPAVRARAHLLRARAIAATDPKARRAELDAALADAAAARDPGLEAEVVLATVILAAGTESADRIDALLPVARAAVTRAGDPRPLAHDLAKAEFEAHARLGRAEPARDACTRMVGLAESERTTLETTGCKCKIALILRERAAVEACDESLEVMKKFFGEKHPRTADAAHNWITALVRTGGTKEAEIAAHANVALMAEIYGHDSSAVVSEMQLLSVVQDRLDKVAESRATLEKALEISDRVSGPDAVDRAGLLLELADRALQQKDKAAIQYAQSGLAASERLLGTEHRDLAAPLVTYAKALALDPAQMPHALEAWRRAVAVAEKNGPQSVVLAYILNSYAFFLARHEMWAEALEIEKRALPMFEALGEKPNATRAESLIGEIYLEMKNKPEARSWLTKARDHFIALGDKYKDELDEVEKSLAAAR
jgi:eukaryotic-like serine/threonine-protein kinase